MSQWCVSRSRSAAAASPFHLSHVSTDNGSRFSPAFAKVYAELGAEYLHTERYSPQTNGMAERFNGRVGNAVLGITSYSHRDLEQLLRGFNAAHNARRRRVLNGKTPNQVVAERREAKPELANAKPHGRAGPCDTIKACLVAQRAKEVSQPDRLRIVSDQGDERNVQPTPAAEEGKLNESSDGRNLRPDLAQQLYAGCHRAAGGQQVIHQHHALSRLDRIGLDFDAIGAVFEVVV